MLTIGEDMHEWKQEGAWEISVPSPPSCSECTTALKRKPIKKDMYGIMGI